MRARRGSGRAMAAAARRAAPVPRRPPRPTRPATRQTARHGHRLDLDVGARLISVDLQEHPADAQGGALAMSYDDLDLFHTGSMPTSIAG
jgi:hypothetical protein